jgi:hypothetical protein
MEDFVTPYIRQTICGNGENASPWDTRSELGNEWANPSVVVPMVLFMVGGQVIQEALAQTTGNTFSPVCFSFGWVTYVLSNLKTVFGDGRLLPAPDYPVKVFNLKSGYYINNKNWVVGRIVRDHESFIESKKALYNHAIRIAVYEAEPIRHDSLTFRYTHLHLWAAAIMLLQLTLAAIPTILTGGREWGVLCVTGLGTLMALWMGSLPQWRVEKLPNRRDSNEVFGLTTGNGCRDVMIIKGLGRCLNVEELAISESPRMGRPWTKFRHFSVKRHNSDGWQSKVAMGIPVGFFITRIVCLIQALVWFLILVSIGGIRSHCWFLIAIGAIGLLFNNTLAELNRNPRNHNLPLKLVDTIMTRKVMDGLMDLEVTHEGSGENLLPEFFPGRLRSEEQEWWKASKKDRPTTKYDLERMKQRVRRSTPRSVVPIHTPDQHDAEDYPTRNPGEPTDRQRHTATGTVDYNASDNRMPNSRSDNNSSRQQLSQPPEVGRVSHISGHEQAVQPLLSDVGQPPDNSNRGLETLGRSRNITSDARKGSSQFGLSTSPFWD